MVTDSRPQRPITTRVRSLLACLSAAVLGIGLSACGEPSGGALDEGDPLHTEAVKLPPLELVLPPRPSEVLNEDGRTFAVPPPPFSPGIFPCSRCHEGGAGVADTLPAMPHLLHLDEGFGCADCHSGGDPMADVSVPSADVCGMCHSDLELDEDVPGVAGYFARIKSGDDEYVFPRRWKTQDVIANHEGHAAAGIECAACHGEASDGPFPKPRNVALMQSCLDCHEERQAPTDCASCHREIREPQHANISLHHSENMTTCFVCHDEENRDVLRMAHGELLPFEESWRLCGQCHGPKLRDWKQGLHGKRIGMWDGERQYLLCVHCHSDPHAPSFPRMEPLPPPVRPEDIR